MSLLKTLPHKIAVAAAGLLACVSLANAASTVTPRITQRVEETRLTRLSGNVPFLARPQFDRGEAAPSTQMTHVRLVLSRSPEQQAALSKLQTELLDKSSANYHKWLTPAQFGQLYGPADSDIAAITAWLESHGLKVEEVDPGRTNIAFSGSVSQIEEAFHTQIHAYETTDRKFLANATEPRIPTALSSVILGVARLNTIRPRPHHIGGQLGTFNPESNRLAPAASERLSGIHPDLTTGSGTSEFLYLTPGDAATIYDTPNTTFNANYTSGTSYSGSGVTIGIGGDAAIQTSTIVDYRTRFLGSSYATAPGYTNVDGVTDTSDTDEAYIDNELSGGMAPGATIHYYTSNDLVTGIQTALNDNKVDIFSLSFGECELYLATSDNALINGWWSQAATQGIAVTVSTGDNGSAACDNPTDSSGNNVAEAVLGLNVSGFASTPFNIAVGGTDLAGVAGSFSTYAPPPASGSASAKIYRSAVSYIPEATWNDSPQADGKISGNIAYTAASGNQNIASGSGGKSNCSTNTDTSSTVGTCTSGYTKPAWQRGAGVPSDGVRDMPDVSLMAGNGADAATWAICTDATGTDSSNNPISANCTTQTNGSFYFQGFGGTSTAAPAFAGILALVQQKTGSRLGQAAKELYDLYNGSHSTSVFHDITVGNNSVACTSGTPDCVLDTAGYYFESGYDTGTGYDLATGLGSVDAKQLVTYWGTAIGSTAASVTVTPTPTTITSSQSLTVASVVTGASGTPTGTVTLSSGSYTSSAQTLTAGGYSFTVPAGTLPEGTDTLTVTYSGDTTYATSTGTASVTVLAPNLVLTSASLTFPTTLVGSSAPSQTVTLKNTGNATLNLSTSLPTGTGASSFLVATTCGATVAAGASCTLDVTFTPTAAGTLTATITLTDNAAGSPQTITLTGTGATPQPAVSLSPTSLTFGSTTVGSPAAPLTVTVKNTGNGPLVISGASLSGTNASSFSQTNTCTTVAVSGTCVITVTFTPTTFGTLTATLSIADNATGSPQTVSLTGTGVEAGSYALTAGASSPASVAPGSSATSTITATPSGGYTGSITLTCSVGTVSGGTAPPTCAVTGSPIAITSGAATATVTVSTTAPSTLAKGGKIGTAQLQNRTKGWLAAGGTALACVLFFGIPARRRNWNAFLGLLILFAGLGTIAGCGGGGGGTVTQPIPGTSAGTYTVTVNGVDAASVKQSTTFTVVVN